MQSNLKDVNFNSLEKPLVEYIKRSNRKAGVLVAGFVPELNKVVLGFTLCHSKLDKWDWIKTGKGKEKVPGFGKDVATKRAIKWETKGRLQNVVIPESILKELSVFVLRCKAYYKDKKQLSDWVLNNHNIGRQLFKFEGE
jgi:hypothetical protein